MEFKICRVCLDRTATISVFDKQDDTQYCVKLMKCVNVSIAEGDGFPDSICEGCANDLAISYDFAQRCEASDKALRCLGLLQAGDPELKTEAPTVKYEVKPEYGEPSGHEDLDAVTYNFQGNEFQEENLQIEQDGLNHENHTKKTQYKYQEILLDNLPNKKWRLKTGPIKCTLCDRVVTCHSALELHMRRHTKEKPYTCDVCRKTFVNKHTLKIHLQKHFDFVLKTNTQRMSIELDRRRHRPKKGPFQCTICGRVLSSHAAMEDHMRTHTGEKPFACELCGSKYRLKGTLKRHLSSRHPEAYPQSSYTCEHCGKSFNLKNNIIIHMRIHTGDRPYLCPFCPQRFRQISTLIRHKRRHTGERPYVCSICGKSFSDKTVAKKHQSVHSDEKKFTCHICSKSIKTKAALKIHIDCHSKKKEWICSFCGMVFTFKGNLKTHIGRKHSEKSGMCYVCKKEFGDLEAHMRVHTGEKPFTCKICDQSYGSKRSLSKHMGFKHRDSSKFKCNVNDCSKSFPAATMLEFHVLKHHSDTTPYVCHHCARGFLRACDLSRHLKVNHMDTQTQVKSVFSKVIKI